MNQEIKHLERVIVSGEKVFTRLDRYIAMEREVTVCRDTVYKAILAMSVDCGGNVNLSKLVTPNGTDCSMLRKALMEVGHGLIRAHPEMAYMEVNFDERICNDIVYCVTTYHNKEGVANPTYI